MVFKISIACTLIMLLGEQNLQVIDSILSKTAMCVQKYFFHHSPFEILSFRKAVHSSDEISVKMAATTFL